MTKCVLFDRDGTLGVLTDERYPNTIQPFCEVKTVFRKIKDKGYKVGILTNQSSIARGTGKDYPFDAEFRTYGVDFYELCPHDDKDNCDCRKPKTGLFVRLFEKTGLKPEECILVGDRYSDMLCAKTVGANCALVLTGKGEKEKARVLSEFPDIPVLARFDEVLELL